MGEGPGGSCTHTLPHACTASYSQVQFLRSEPASPFSLSHDRHVSVGGLRGLLGGWGTMGGANLSLPFENARPGDPCGPVKAPLVSPGPHVSPPQLCFLRPLSSHQGGRARLSHGAEPQLGGGVVARGLSPVPACPVHPQPIWPDRGPVLSTEGRAYAGPGALCPPHTLRGHHPSCNWIN